MPELSSRGKQFALVGADKEQILVGTVEAIRPSGQAAVLARRAEKEGLGLRYGYPLVTSDPNATTSDKASWRVAPLLVVDVDVLPDGRITRSGEVELNTELLDHWIDWSPQERDALVDEFQADWAQGDHKGLAEKVQHYLGYAGIRPLQTIRPTTLLDDLEMRHPRAGAHNTALLHTDEASSTMVTKLLEDYEKTLLESVDTFSQTALAGLEGPPQSAQEVGGTPEILVTPSPTNEAQQDIIRSAMSRRLTVATGPPGTGKSQLITGVVATAIGAGESVLIASTNNTAVDVVVDRSNQNATGSVIRTGKKQFRDAVGESLRELVTAVKDHAPLDSSVRAAARSWQQECADRAAELDHRAEAEHELAAALLDRTRLLPFLRSTPLEESHFTGLSDYLLERWRRQAHRAANWGILGFLDRWMLRRHLNIEVDRVPTFLDLVDAELGVRRRGRDLAACRDEQNVLKALRTAQDNHRSASAELLRSKLRSTVEAGEEFILDRATALSGTGAKTWTGFQRLLEFVPAWATTTLATRPSIVPKQGLFDLVIIDEASQCPVAQVLPLLFRAKRALIIGDPHQLSHITNLEQGHLDRAATDAGLPGE